MTKFLEKLKKPRFLAILGSFSPILSKSELSQKNGLCQFLQIFTIMQKKTEKTYVWSSRKLLTDGQTDRKQYKYPLSTGVQNMSNFWI